MQVHREPASHRTQKLFIPLDPEAGMQSALHHYLGRAELNSLLDSSEDVVGRQQVGIRIVDIPTEGAEAACGDTNVGVVDVAIYDIGAVRFRVQLSAYTIGRKAQFQEIAFFDEPESVLA